jgi:hypothetical protein
MAINIPATEFKIDGDHDKEAERLMDLLFPYFPDLDTIILQSIIHKSNLSEPDKAIALHLSKKIENLMYSTFFYAKKTIGYYGSLTTLGRKVKLAGGHFAYLDKIKNEKEINSTRQSLIDKKLVQDYTNAEFEGKQGRRFKLWHILIALIGGVLIPIFIWIWKCLTS